MFFQRGRPKLSKFLYNSFGGASSGDLFNGTYAFYAFTSNGDNSITSGTKINERMSVKNYVDDSGNLSTVQPYETAFTSLGEFDEPSATNLLTESNTLDQWSKSGSVQADISPDNGMWRFSRDGTGNSYITEFLSVPLGDIVMSAFVRKGTARYVSLRVQGSYPARCDLVFDFDTETFIRCTVSGGWLNPDCGFIKTSDGYRIFIAAETSVAASGQSAVSFSDTGVPIDGSETSSVDGVIGRVQVEVGRTPNSYIETTTSPATRDADKPSVPSGDKWVDDECFSGTFNNANYTNGIRRFSDSVFFISFADNSAGSEGKYPQLVTADFTGGIALADPRYLVTTSPNSDVLQLTHPNNTEQELLDLFGYPNRYSIAFQTSVYGTSSDHAGIEQLRRDVGDYGVNVITGTSFASLDPSTTVTGMNIAINGSLTLGTPLASTTFEGNYGLKATDYIVIETESTLDAGNTGTVSISGSVVTNGSQTHVIPAFDASLPITVPSVVVNTDGTVIADIKIVSINAFRWLDWKLLNSTTSFKFTPTALTGEGDAMILCFDDVNMQGFGVMIPPDGLYDAFELDVFQGGSSVNVAVPILGGIQIGTTYDMEISITDTDVYFTVNGDTTPVTNTLSLVDAPLNASIPLAGSFEASYSCYIKDLSNKDYQP